MQWAGTLLQQRARETAKCSGSFSTQYARRVASIADALQDPGTHGGTAAEPCFPDGTYCATAAFASWLAEIDEADALAGTGSSSTVPPATEDPGSTRVTSWTGRVGAPAGPRSPAGPADTLLEAVKNYGLPFEGVLAETLARLLDAGQWGAVRELDMACTALPDQAAQPSGDPLGTDLHDQNMGDQEPAGTMAPLLLHGRDEEGMKVEVKEGASSPMGIEPSPPPSIRRTVQEETIRPHPSGPCLVTVASCLSEFWDAAEVLDGGEDEPVTGFASSTVLEEVGILLLSDKVHLLDGRCGPCHAS